MFNSSKTIAEQLEILSQGFVETFPEDGLRVALERAYYEKRPLRVKFGVNPSAPDLHLGHVIPLKKLRQFQDFGHEVSIVIGDFTALIGDPSDRGLPRKKLQQDLIKQNGEQYEKQIFKILDPKKTKIFLNSEWCKNFNFENVIEISSHFSLQKLLERDDFQKRLSEKKTIILTEVLYSLVQGYDSVVLNADIEIGGRDQKFNMLFGREVQKQKDMYEQTVCITPLLEGTDGLLKMSKSLGNSIKIFSDPNEVYKKLMEIPKSTLIKYLENLTDFPKFSIMELKDSLTSKEVIEKTKHELAKYLVAKYHSPQEAKLAANKYLLKASADEHIPEDADSYKVAIVTSIEDVLHDTGLACSKSEMEKLISEEKVKLNGVVIKDKNIQLNPGEYKVLKVNNKYIKLR